MDCGVTMRRLIKTASGELQITDAPLEAYPDAEVLQENVPKHEFVKIVNNKVVIDTEKKEHSKKKEKADKLSKLDLLEKIEALEARVAALEGNE
jgi:hypothetical protein